MSDCFKAALNQLGLNLKNGEIENSEEHIPHHNSLAVSQYKFWFDIKFLNNFEFQVSKWSNLSANQKIVGLIVVHFLCWINLAERWSSMGDIFGSTKDWRWKRFQN